MAGRESLNRALVGKSGEALVAAELLRRHVDVAYPAFDGGVDLIAYRGHDFKAALPIQVKARSSTCYVFQRKWLEVPNIILIQVWYVVAVPQFFIFRNIADVEGALGLHATSNSWCADGRYSVTNPNKSEIDRMQPYRDRWNWIEDALHL